jgi:hypothetical protein
MYRAIPRRWRAIYARCFVRRGLRIERITLADLFPQTFHLETVVRLRR